jgi:nitrate reductase assembly molybdenum cofactor insertion protein NarJ
MNRRTADTTHIAAAAEWRLIGLLLERPRRGWHEEVARLAGEVQDGSLRGAAAMARDASEGEYLRLFGPGGVVSPREVTYQPFADPGQLLAELAAVYGAFAFRPQVEEPLDHIAVEAAFVGYLLLKEAFALARGDRAAAATTAKARRDFVAAHLAALGTTFAQRLEDAGPAYVRPVGRLLAARLPARRTSQPPRSGVTANICGACGIADAS